MGKIKKERIGETNFNNKGLKMTILSYEGFWNMLIQFDNGEKKKTNYWQFKTGQVKSETSEEYITDAENMDKNGKYLKSYVTWENMRTRCNNKNYLEKNPTYKGCKIYEDWKKYSNFKKWFDENYYEIDGEKMCLDKDILVKGNKLYSPSTCIFVPVQINTLFKSHMKNNNLPTGVNKIDDRYVVIGVSDKSTKQLGSFDTIQEAFDTYKKYKENLIKEVAEQYKNKIPIKLYDVMLNYKIKIID